MHIKNYVTDDKLLLFLLQRPDAESHKKFLRKMRIRHAFTEFFFSRDQLSIKLKTSEINNDASGLTSHDNQTGYHEEISYKLPISETKKEQLDEKAYISMDFFSSVYLREKRKIEELPTLIDRLEKYTLMKVEELPLVIVISEFRT